MSTSGSYDSSDSDPSGVEDENDWIDGDVIFPNPEPSQEIHDRITQDFERLVENIDDGPSTLGWTFSIEEDASFNPNASDSEPDDPPSQKATSKSRTRNRLPEMSHQVKSLIGLASSAYVEQDLERALSLCQEAIRIEPSALPAWNTMALVHEDMGDFATVIKLRIMAAHLEGDSTVWRELGAISRENGQSQQALYCFRKAVALDPRDVDAIWDRSVMLKETGEIRAAMSGFLSILKVVPHHMGVLLELGTLFSALSEFSKGVSILSTSLAYYQTQAPNPDATLLIVTLADFLSVLGEHERGIRVIRDGERWLQGRKGEVHWTHEPDDREYDPKGFVREGGGRQGFHPLDPNLRHRLALARLNLGDLEEGQMHGTLVLENDIREYSPLFLELAGAYYDKGLFEAALRVYEELATRHETVTVPTLMQIASCHRHLNDLDKCASVYQHIIDIDKDNVEAKMKLAEVYETLDDPSAALELVNEVIAWKRLHAPKSGLVSSTPQPESNGSLFLEKKKLTKTKTALPLEVVQAMERTKQKEIDEQFNKIQSLDPEDPMQRTEWIQEAGNMIDTFRETRELFGGNRFVQFRGSVNERRLKRMETLDVEDMVDRLRLRDNTLSNTRKGASKPLTAFRGHEFDEWLSLIIQYAFYTTRDGMYAAADEMLRHVIFSNAFVTFAHQNTIRLALLACATVERDYPAILEHSRKLMFSHPFNNDPIRLFLACLGGGIHSIDSFIDTKFQKALRREVDLYKAASVPGVQPKWIPTRNRWNFKTAGGSDDEGEEDDVAGERKKKGVPNATVASDPAPSLATRESPVLLALYGQLSSAAKSYQSALFYLYQAYDLQPDDPVICMSLSVASISRAMQRQCDNRHHMIAQGFGFMQKYRAIRLGESEEEAEYNMGRMFHQLGLLTHAMDHYERVLALAESRRDHSKQPSLCKEAAYNLVLIYSTTGGAIAAQETAAKWLSF